MEESTIRHTVDDDDDSGLVAVVPVHDDDCEEMEVPFSTDPPPPPRLEPLDRWFYFTPTTSFTETNGNTSMIKTNSDSQNANEGQKLSSQEAEYGDDDQNLEEEEEQDDGVVIFLPFPSRNLETANDMDAGSTGVSHQRPTLDSRATDIATESPSIREEGEEGNWDPELGISQQREDDNYGYRHHRHQRPSLTTRSLPSSTSRRLASEQEEEDDPNSSPNLMVRDNQDLDDMGELFDVLRRYETNTTLMNVNNHGIPSTVSLWTDVDTAAATAEPLEATVGPSSDNSCLCFWSRWLCFPLVAIITVSTGLSVLVFCILPGMAFLAISVALYYCCTRNPVPLRVLLQAMLFDENDLGENAAGNPLHSAVPPLSKKDISDALLLRRCTAVCHSKTPHQQKLEAPLTVVTDNFTLCFSEPISEVTNNVVTAVDDDDDDDDCGREDFVAPRSLMEVDDSDPVGGDEEEGLEMTVTVATSVGGGNGIADRQRRVPPTTDEESLPPSDVSNHEQQQPSLTQDALMSIPIPKSGGENAVQSAPKNDHENNNSNGDISDSNSSDLHQHERGTACDICLLRYRSGHVVAWSRNPACSHAFHIDCITDWLQHCRNNSCPNCRRDYLYLTATKRKSKLNAASSVEEAS